MIGMRLAGAAGAALLALSGCEFQGQPRETRSGVSAGGTLARAAEPKVVLQHPADRSSQAAAEVGLVAAVENGGDVRSVTITVNDRLVRTQLVPAGAPARIPVEAPVPLDPGRNLITVAAATGAGRRYAASVTVERIETAPAPAAGPVGRRWAVVVGISRYLCSDKGIPALRFAHRDARAFLEFLQSPQGGGFRPEHCRLLLDEEATTVNLRTALFTFLKGAAPDDLVLIFFAGHGAPEPGRPDNLYLLTYDADPESLAATAFPMWDMETALKRYIQAERVVVLADACHSGGVAGEGLREAGSANLIHTYLANLQKTRPGRAILTASEANQLSREGERWDGHGVFTYYLLKGLKGEADADGNGVVTIAEAFNYVYDQVRRATDSQQHPNIQGRFDRNLPLGVTEVRKPAGGLGDYGGR